MKLFTGWVLSAGLVFASAAANAQVLAPYSLTSDVDGPYANVGGRYAAVVQEAPGPAYGPRLLPALEVYTIVRESGFSPLGIPQQRGLVYTIAVIDRGGDDGRLVIDARTGRIIRFMPASRMGDNFNDALTTTYGPPGPLPPVNFRSGPPPLNNARAVPRPPRAIPRVASRTPSASAPPPHAGEVRPLAARPAPAPAQQSAAAPAKPADPQTTGQAAAPAQAAVPATVEPKPAPQIAPTQDMPKAQGLD
jgi:hypothetical protein